MALKGIIFDFDGLIIDTEMPCCNAWIELFNQHGFPFTVEDYQNIIGTGHNNYDPSKHLSELINGRIDPLSILEQNRSRTLHLLESQTMLPGVLDFIIAANREGLPMAIASSSNRDWIESFLLKLGIRKYFEVVCTANDVLNVKPFPDLFLLAIKRLGIDPSETIIFEDSPNGIKAAKLARISCIAVPNEITRSMDLSQATRIVDSFLHLNLQEFFNSK